MYTPMWTGPAGHSGSRAQTRTGKSNSESTTAFGTTNLDSSSRIRPAASQHHYTASSFEAEIYADFLEPAVDGPPSPAVIRALNDKAKQASVSERHVSQQNNSPGASSLISYASLDRRPSWEQSLDSFSLSRKSSVKSTTSSMPSKERPESVQAIGKAIFHRKSKLRRESLTGNSTDLAPEVPNERSRAGSYISKDHVLAAMGIFNRRKTVQAGEEASQKKPMISMPYNFQHVTQIHKDQLPHLERGNQSTLHGELSGVRTPPAMSEDLRVPNFASGRTRPRDEDESVPPHVVLHSRDNSTSRPSSIHKSHPRQWVKQTKSQDHIRAAAPPRPPRSPTQLNMGYFDFVPPTVPSRDPRRPSIPRRDSEALGNISPSRQQSAAESRFHSPLHLQEATGSTPPASPGRSNNVTQERRFSRIFVPAESPDWPLSAPVSENGGTAFDSGLAEVPEEEELCDPPSTSHPNVKSSLKGSISVPALRKASHATSKHGPHDRTFSRDSVVLTNFDMAAYRHIAEVDMSNRAQIVDPLRRDSWEAVIDYCYEHEMEADCDYDWHRPSLDVDHEPRVMVTESGDDSTIMSRPPSDCIDLPILSPSHHLSPQSSQEIITPWLSSAPKSPTSANFSLPRRERPQRLLHVRNESQISFTEAQGFPLSPSFLIPTDYHQELLAAQTRKFEDAELIAQAVTLEDSALQLQGANLFVAARASASTTASHSNLSSQSISERHISATSTNTDYTRLTMSVSSEDLEGFNFKDDNTPGISGNSEEHFPISSPTHSRSRSAAGLLGAVAQSPGLSRDTHCSESNLASSQQKAAGRARSKTLSSTPAGGFSLFPAVTKAPPRG